MEGKVRMHFDLFFMLLDLKNWEISSAELFIEILTSSAIDESYRISEETDGY